jgi:hypothetical protein
MCIRCKNVEEELDSHIVAHSKEHGRCEPGCILPPASSDFRSSAYWLLAVAHAKLDVVLDRMETAKRLFDNPQDVSSDVLLEWEQHVMEAARLFATARHNKQKAEQSVATETRQ